MAPKSLLLAFLCRFILIEPPARFGLLLYGVALLIAHSTYAITRYPRPPSLIRPGDGEDGHSKSSKIPGMRKPATSAS